MRPATLTTTSEPRELPGDVSAAPEQEHAVFLTCRASDGSPGDVACAIEELGEALDRAARSAGVGELDGWEWRDGEVTYYLYGPDCRPILTTVGGVLSSGGSLPVVCALQRPGGLETEARVAQL